MNKAGGKVCMLIRERCLVCGGASLFSLLVLETVGGSVVSVAGAAGTESSMCLRDKQVKLMVACEEKK